jgi:cation transport ATPase
VGAKADLDALRARGLQLRMLSGDSPVTAQAVAAQLGFAPQDVQAGMLPGDKAQAVRDWHAQGHVVAFVGDGINDAPALVAADLGMAMAQADTGTDVAMHAAGLTLMRGELRLVGQALDVCRLTVQKIRQNLFWAFVFNAAGIPLAAGVGRHGHVDEFTQRDAQRLAAAPPPRPSLTGLQALLGKGDVPVQASGVGHGIAVEHLVDGLTEQEFFDRQLLFFA